MGDSDKVKSLLDDARSAGVEVRLPDISRSSWEFEPEAGAIRFGLGAIKGVGQRAVEQLVAARQALIADKASIGLHTLASQVDPTEVGKTAWESLIKAGTFDSSGHNRGAVLAALEAAMADGARAAADRRSGQGDLFGAAPAEPRAAASDGIDDSKAWDEQETLKAEYEVLGFYLSGHPLEERAGLMNILASVGTDRLAELQGGAEVRLAGMVVGYAEAIVKSGRMAGQKMARFRLEDLKGSVGVTCFPRTFEECRDKLEEGAVVVLKGKLEDRSDEPALLLDELMTVEEAIERFQGGVVIQLGPEDKGVLPALEASIKANRGTQPLYFLVRGDDGHSRRIRAGSDWSVAISDGFAREVDGLLGRGRVRLARV
jgi:DNA polymerase-3 subunit alpha